MEKVALFIIKLLKHPIKWSGADYEQVEVILRTKLSMDFRRSPSMFHSSGNTNRTMNYQLFVLLIFGVFISLGFASINNLLLNLTICFSIIMVMLGSSIITEFTSVLFDHRDNHILLVRPISNRTLLLSRLLHILVYIGFMAVSLALIPSIVIAIKQGVLTFLAFWLAIGLCAWITLLITSFFYMALSKFVSGERFKDLVSYFQIFLAIVIFGGYQLLPRMMESDALQHTTMTIHWWTYLIPPVWIAGFVNLFNSLSFTFENIVLSILAIFSTIAGATFLIRNLSSGFGSVLSEGAAEKIENNSVTENSKTKFSFLHLLCISELEQTGWKLAMSITKRDRKFKQAVYPSFGIMFVMAFLMIKPDFSSLAVTLQKLNDPKNFFIFIFLCFFGTTAITQLPFTDTPEGSWIYKALPITKHGHILTGAIKAVLFKFFLPVLVILFTVSLSIWGISKLPELFLGSMLIILVNQYSIIFMKMNLPFTQARDMQQKGTNMARMFLLMFLMAITIGFIYLSTLLNIWIVIAVIGLLFLMIINAYSQIRKRNYIVSGF
jgi:ABC-2 type transport system permease protein